MNANRISYKFPTYNKEREDDPRNNRRTNLRLVNGNRSKGLSD